MDVKGVKLDIIKGDITELDVEAIVNSASRDLIMEAGLAGIIKKKGGGEIEKEAHSKGPLKVGQAVWTKAGSLQIKYIIHTVALGKDKTTDEGKLRKAIQSVFKCVDELKLKSLAFPALGCGVGGFSFIGAAKILTQEVIKYLRMNKTSLTKIIFCLYDDESFRSFDGNIRNYLHHLHEDLGYGPYITVDVIIELKEGIILIERSNPPYGWALPGGFLDYGESLDEAARREAKEETNLDLKDLRQFHTYSDPERDPRFQTVSTVYIGKGLGTPRFGDDAKGLKIVPYRDLPKLKYAFDHNQIILDYLRLRKKTRSR